MYQHTSLVEHEYEQLDTFHFNEQEYRINAVVKLKPNVKSHWNAIPKMVQLVKHTVMDGYYHTWLYAFWFETGVVTGHYTHEPPEKMIDYVVIDGKEKFDEELSNCCPKEKEAEFSKELFCAWALYVIVMLLFMFFRGFIVGWVFATGYFIWWHNNKKQSLNYYKYGFDYNKMVNTFKSHND